jgi:excisionase family DNA binding protein
VTDMVDAFIASASDEQIARLAERLAPLILRLQPVAAHPDEWLDTAGAAEYLGVHRDTINKLAVEGKLPSEQDAPGCKRWFQRGELDDWRRGGGAAQLRRVA